MNRKAKTSGQRKTTNRPRPGSGRRREGKFSSYRAVKALNSIRDKAKLSLQDIADTIGRKRHAVWKWLAGMSRPTVEIRVKIKEEYGTPMIAWLTTEEIQVIKDRLKLLRQKEKLGNKLTRSQQRLRSTLLSTLGEA